MTNMDYVGLAGGILLAYSNIPQIIMFLRQKHARGISKFSIWLWAVGLVLKFAYSIHTTGYNKIILMPYALSMACCVVTLYYCYFGADKLEDAREKYV